LVVTKLDRLARSLPDARAITDELTVRQVRLNLGGSVYEPTDSVGRLLFNELGDHRQDVEQELTLGQLSGDMGRDGSGFAGRADGRAKSMPHSYHAGEDVGMV